MWQIFKAELAYLRRFLLGYGLFIPLVTVQQMRPFLEDLSAYYMLFWLCFVAIQNSLVFRNKERRELCLARLPVACKNLAFVRLGLMFMTWLLFWAIFAFFSILFSTGIDFNSTLISAAVLCSGFSLYFIVRDNLYPFFRNIGVTSQRFTLATVLLFTGSGVLGLFLFIQTSKSGTAPVSLDFLAAIGRYFKYADAGEAIKITAGGSLLALLSIISFQKRQSHLE